MEAEKNSKQSDWKKRMYIVVAVIFAVVTVISAKNHMEKKKIRDTFEEIQSGSEHIATVRVPEIIKTEDLVLNAEGTYTSTVARNKFHDWYDWTETFAFTIFVEEEFDDWTELQQYEYIDALGDEAYSLISELVRKQYPEYDKYRDFLYGPLQKIYPALVSHDKVFDLYIKTSKNTYEYASNVDYYFIKSGDEVYVRDVSGNWKGKVHTNTYTPYVSSVGGKCALSHCDFDAKEGSPYCSRHGCCVDGCRNKKDPTVHCCSEHNCKEQGCGKHRYTLKGSEYCSTHWRHHYND